MTPEWYGEERGITKETLDAFGVRFVGNETIFKYATGDKSRYFDEEGKRRFKFTKGMRPSLYTPPHIDVSTSTAFLTEGETDTMRLWQELGDSGAHVAGLGGVDTWRDEFAEHFRQFDRVFVILDNDTDYNTVSQVDAVWLRIRKDLGSKAKRIRLPSGVKDVCEFFKQGYDLDDLRTLADRNLESSRFHTLDLNAPAEPPRWLVEGLVALGDVTLLSGASGLGKSWVTMGLAQVVADGAEVFLGRAVKQGGRVLYVDEENPEDVVKMRLKQLGLVHKGNVRYIWNNGVRLDRNPDVLLEEALDFQPTLIVLDSLTRIHSGEENSVGDMAPLLNDAIRPLARETGAAVLLIHHHDKGDNGPRGSGDILASVDAALSTHPTYQESMFTLALKKSRRKITGESFTVHISDKDDGGVALLAIESFIPNF